MLFDPEQNINQCIGASGKVRCHTNLLQTNNTQFSVHPVIIMSMLLILILLLPLSYLILVEGKISVILLIAIINF